MTNIDRREFLKAGLKSAAALGVMGAVDFGFLLRKSLAAGIDPFDGIKNLAEPLFAAPAMTTPGSVLDIKLKAPGSELKSAALVSADGAETPLNAEKADGGWAASLAGVAPGTYHLKVSSVADGAVVDELQPRAVAVYGDFKDDFDFVFFADIHFGEHQEKTEELILPGNKEYYLLRAKTLLEIEKYNPEFIVFGGDMCLYPKNYHWGFPESYAFMTHYLKSPIHMMPGNHDSYHMEVEELGGKYVRAKDFWDKYYGVYYHSFDYGKFHVSCVNTTDWPDEFTHWGTKNTTTGSLLSVGIQKEQFMWLKADLEDAVKRGSDKIVCGHIPFHNVASGKKVGLPPVSMPGASEERIMKLLEANGVKDIFVGHLHKNDVMELAGGVTENMIRNIGGDYINSTKAGFAVLHVRGGKFDGYDLIDMKA